MEFGHNAWRGSAGFVDGWGAGPYCITVKGKRYYFEDSDRFGPAWIDPKTGDPTNELIPLNHPFWKAWERWRDEGRRTVEGKPLGKRGNRTEILYCQHSDLRKDRAIDGQ